MSAFANHLWQSTAFAGLAALLAMALRRNRAHLRYWVWLAASVKFLLPFSVLVAVGSRVEWRSAPAIPAPIASAIEQVAVPFENRSVTEAARVEGHTPGREYVVGVWLIGCAIVLARWRVRWRRIQAALRTAWPLTMEAPVAVMCSDTRLEPGIFGVFRPILLLPQGLADRLTPAQFRAIVAHELCHVRRRDNLTAALQMAVEAIFWFHPVVWWIGARLVEERERACDEEVLRMGSEPEVYAAGILNVCKFYLESPLACASGVTGADLKKRVEEIMTKRLLVRLTTARKLLLAGAALAAVAGPICIGIVDAPAGRAQAAQERLRFEVATIKPFQGGGGKSGLQILPGGGLRLEGTTLHDLVTLAYGVHPKQVTGGRGWMETESYQLLAKPERPTAADNPRTTVAPGTVAWHRLELRLQTLLEERFQLKVHKLVKEESGYALVPAKNGTKLTPEAENLPAGTMRGPGVINGRNGTMAMLATVLSQLVGRPVTDGTGFTAGYTYKLEYRQETPLPGRGAGDNPPDAGPPDLSAGPSVFTALQEQLGLKLEPAKVSVETIVIDRAERPSAN